jgi:hypothetical protein
MGLIFGGADPFEAVGNMLGLLLTGGLLFGLCWLCARIQGWWRPPPPPSKHDLVMQRLSAGQHVPWSEIIEDPEELRAYFAGLEAYFARKDQESEHQDRAHSGN